MLTELYWHARTRLGSAAFVLSSSTLPQVFLATGSAFIHVPKAAGTSVCQALYGRQLGHRSIREYERIDKERLSKLFKFTVVRDPWERFVSAYFFLINGGMTNFPADRQFAQSILSRYSDVNHFATHWLNPRNAMCYHHFKPQTWFLKDSSNRIAVDFIARQETLERDFGVLRDRLGVSAKLPCFNPTRHPRFSEILAPEAIDVIAHVYAEDIDLLRY